MLVLTNEEADLLRRALAEVKTKAFKESELTLDDPQALGPLVRVSERTEKRKKHAASLPTPSANASLGTIIARHDGADSPVSQ